VFQGGEVERRKLLRCQGDPVPEAAMLNLTQLIDDAKCYESVRQMRWSEGICCFKCSTQQVIKRGKDETQPQQSAIPV